MKTKPTHTPTPWIVNKAPKYFATAPVMAETLDASGGKPYMAPVSYPVGKAETAEDAAFIVRAVNAHEELVAMVRRLREILTLTVTCDIDDLALDSEIKTLLAKAEAA